MNVFEAATEATDEDVNQGIVARIWNREGQKGKPVWPVSPPQTKDKKNE